MADKAEKRNVYISLHKLYVREGIEYKKGNVIITDYFEHHGAERAGEDHA